MTIVETRNLTFSFTGGELVLNDLHLNVEQGSIYGFLGPNGAGKTTTLRLMLGLLKKQAGTISIFGKPFKNNRVEILKNVGSLIESPSLYGHLTAVENLTLLQKIYGCPKERIQDILILVGLNNTGNKKANQFSLGMKQRLSVAIALLHEPSLLILDEPSNGLDPNGTIEIRELLKNLNHDRGVTIIISSHLLSEIERLVTHIGIINKGKMMFEGTLDALKSKQQQSISIVFETSDHTKTVQIIEENNLQPGVKNGKIVIPAVAKETIARINQQLVENGIEVYEMSVMKNDLEAIFIDIVNNEEA